MKKTKQYSRTRFPANVIKEAHEVFLAELDPEKDHGLPSDLYTKIHDESWKFDSIAEFFAAYPRARSFRFHHTVYSQDASFWIFGIGPDYLEVTVEFPDRPRIETVFQVFEANLADSSLPVQPVVPRIFIGHGHNTQWRDLKDHLQDQHGYEVEAYEIGPRAGLSVKDILEKMVEESSFALLVLTGEDEHTDGTLHARENVIHELGLFQGRLGFQRAIALLEDGVNEFSNILGINQIRFPKGSIRATFGDVVATIRRESTQDS